MKFNVVESCSYCVVFIVGQWASFVVLGRSHWWLPVGVGSFNCKSCCTIGFQAN
jgi:hypothetical protein